MTGFNPLSEEQVNGNAEPKEEFNPLLEEGDLVTPSRTEKQKDRSANLYSSFSTRSPAEIRGIINAGTEWRLEEEAQTVITENNRVAVEGAVSDRVTDETLAEMYLNVSQTPVYDRITDPSLTATLLTSGDVMLKEYARRSIERTIILVDSIESSMSKASERDFATDLAWTDSVLSQLPFLSSFQAKKRNELAQEIMSHISNPAITNEEYGTLVAESLKTAADQGLLTDENRFFIQDLVAIISEGDEAYQSQFALALLDVVVLDASLAVRGGKVVKTIGKAGWILGADLSLDVARVAGKVKRQEKLVDSILADARLSDTPETSAVTLGDHTESLSVPSVNRSEYLSAPAQEAKRDFENNNTAFNELISINFGQALDEGIVEGLRAQFIDIRKRASAESGTRQFIDFDVSVDGLGNVFFQEVIGTSTGKYFKSLAQAKVRAKALGGEVRQVADGQFAVLRSKAAPLNTKIEDVGDLEDLFFFKATDDQELGLGFWAKFGSPLVQTTDRLNAILKQGEAARSTVKTTVLRNHNKLLKSLKKVEVREVGAIFDSMLNGRLAKVTDKTDMTVEQFNTEFFRLHRKNPNTSQQAFFVQTQELNKLDYFLRADPLFKQATDAKETMLYIGDDAFRAVKTETIPADRLVYDIDKKKLVQPSEVPDGAPIYQARTEVFRGLGGESVEYAFARTPTTRRVYHTDVLNYNPGGHREYLKNSIKFYLKQTVETALSGTGTVKTKPRTFMGVRTEQEAKEVVRQWDNIVDALAVRVGETSTDEAFLRGATALKGDSALDALVLSNNAWNRNIQSFSDLLDFSKDAGMKLNRKVDFAADGKPLSQDPKGFLSGINPDEDVAISFRNSRNGKRQDSALLGYGGDVNPTLDPLDSLERGFSSSVAIRSEMEYSLAAINGLIKQAMEKKVLLNPSEIKGLPITAKLKGMKIDDSTEVGKKLALEQKRVEFRLRKKSAFAKAWDQKVAELGDFFYGKDFKWTAKQVDKMSADPISALRGYVFDSKLGLFAPGQYFVQASQVVNIAGLGDGISGFIGTAAYAPTRFALLNGNPTVIREIAERIAPIMGLTPDQYVEMVGLLKSSGRDIVGISVAELGDAAAGASPALRGLREKGRFFFNEGELVARISAHNTAYLEFTKKFPGKPALSQEGRRWIAHRQDVLTQAMTHASRGVGQDLPGLQFLTFSWRMSEALFAGTIKQATGGKVAKGAKSVLTGKEKLKLTSTLLATFGLAGLPIGGVGFDVIEDNYGTVVPDSLHTAVRYGLLDVAISSLIQSDTAFSSRVAWGEGLFDVFMNLSSGNFAEVAGGPSYDLVKDGLTVVAGLARGLTSGNVDLAKVSFKDMARMTTTGNRVFDAYTAWTVGEYVSRKGSVVSDSLTKGDAVARAFGIPIKELEAVWAKGFNDRLTKDYLTGVADRHNKLGKVVEDLIRDGEYDRADEINRIITLEFLSKTPSQQKILKRYYRKNGLYSQQDTIIAQEALKISGSGLAERMKGNN